MKPLRLAGVVRQSIVDGPGLRYVLFTQGCPHRCAGCHNPETHSFDGGNLYQAEQILEDIDKNPLLQGVTFSGGEPFFQIEALADLAGHIKKRKLDLWCYTGYTLETLFELAEADPTLLWLLQQIDVLVDGPFELSDRDLTLKFRGSRNQRVLDLHASVQEGMPVPLEQYDESLPV